MSEWLQAYEHLLWWLVPVSIVTFVATLFAIPMLVVRIPRDYFSHDRRHSLRRSNHHPLIRLILAVFKNTVGLVLLLLGVVMLFTPGQGILTMLVGLVLMNYPGKYRIERWLVSQPAVLRSINWLRRRADREPLIL